MAEPGRRHVEMRRVLVAAAVSSLLLAACRNGGGQAAPAPAPSVTAAPAASAAASAPDAQKLVGRWLRSDSDYTIEIDAVGPDGSVDAKYFNPAPIHVSRSGWKSDGTHLGLLVELTDRNYPGSYYTVVYDPGSDSLVGAYHQLAENQTYEIVFSRAPAGPGPAAPTR